MNMPLNESTEQEDGQSCPVSRYESDFLNLGKDRELSRDPPSLEGKILIFGTGA